MREKAELEKFSLLVTCAKGITPYTVSEIRELGLPVLKVLAAAVLTEGDWLTCIKLNLHLRTAQRVLCLLKNFKADDAQQFYDEVKSIPWENYIRLERHFAVRSVVNNAKIRDTRFASLKCKDAIVDRIRDKQGRRPDSGKSTDEAVIFVHWQGENCSVYLDSSGDPLHKRGYRLEGGKAPLQETLAAALIMASDWDVNTAFISPMCGSGTLAIEAATMALKIPPGINRKNWAMLHYKNVPLRDIRKEIKKIKETEYSGRITVLASDINHRAVSMAKGNAKRAGVEENITFHVARFEETDVPDGNGVVMVNPGYGHRMGEEGKLSDDYRQIGDFFKRKCGGKTGAIFTGNPELGKVVGLKTKAKIAFFNGNIDSRLLLYDLYEGSKPSSD